MIPTGYAPRVPVDLRLIDDLSGCELIQANLINKTIELTFRHIQSSAQQTVGVPTAAPLREIISTRQVEPVDREGRSRLLSVAPSGVEALRGVIVRLDKLERFRRAAKAKRADVTVFSVTKSRSPKWGTIAVLDAAPTDAILKFSSVIFVKSVRLTNQRLEMVVEVGEQTMLAALQDPTDEALEVFSWGASAGRLMWHGLLEGQQRPEAIRIVTESVEDIHQELKRGRKTSGNGVLHG